LARVELAFGEHLRRNRLITQARIHLNAALTIFDVLGAKPWSTGAATELRATGVSNRPIDLGRGEALTAQELRVASLAAAGLSNKEIGQKVCMSPRTVGTHLYRPFPKLGITSRAALRDALSALGDAGGASRSGTDLKPETLAGSGSYVMTREAPRCQGIAGPILLPSTSNPDRSVSTDTDRGRRAVTATEDSALVASDRLALELMDDPLARAEARTTSVIPTSSLLLGTTAWTGGHGELRGTRSADWVSLAGPIWESTQIYEGTNQIQRVVIAKTLLG
jgi:DNA-binding CsgD family transcriptional regulator